MIETMKFMECLDFVGGISEEMQQFLTSLQQVDDTVDRALNELVELLDGEDRLTATFVVSSMFMDNAKSWASRYDELCEQ